MGISLPLAALAGLFKGGQGYLADKAASDRQAQLDAQNSANQKRASDMALEQLRLATSGQQLGAYKEGFRPTDVQQEAQGAAQQNTADLGQLVSNPSAPLGRGQDAISRLQHAITIGGTPYTQQAQPDAYRQALDLERAKGDVESTKLKATQTFTSAENQKRIDAANQRAKDALAAPHWTSSSAGVDPVTQQPIFVKTEAKSGQVLPTSVEAKGAGHGGSGAGAQSSIADMQAQHDRMTASENTPNFKVSRSGQVVEGAQYGSTRAAAHGDAPSIGQSVALLGGSMGLGPTDQEKSYLTSGRAFGDEAAKAFKGRQNEEAVLREVATLAAEPTDTPEVIKHKQQRRAAIIQMAITQNPSGAPKGGATDPNQARAAAIKAKYGITTP